MALEIVGKSTTLVKPAAETVIGGGLFCRPQTSGTPIPARYQLVTVDSMDELIRTGSPLGSSLEHIEQQIVQRHQAPHAQTSYLHRFTGHLDIEDEKDEQQRQQYGHRRRRHRRRYYYGEEKPKFDGWLVMDKPVVTADINLPALQILTIELGPVLVTDEHFQELGTEEYLREAGYTVVQRRFGLMQINFNPKRTRLYDYHAAKKAYDYRVNGKFPDDSLIVMFNAMRPSRQGEYPMTMLEVGEDLSADVRDVMGIYRLWKRLWPGKTPWRTGHFSGYLGKRRRGSWGRQDYCSKEFKTAVEECLPFLHGEEQRHKDDKSYQQFCRFLRREAKALGLKVPPKPKEPKKPIAKKARKQCRRASAARKRSTKTKSPSPSKMETTTPSSTTSST